MSPMGSSGVVPRRALVIMCYGLLSGLSELASHSILPSDAYSIFIVTVDCYMLGSKYYWSVFSGIAWIFTIVDFEF